MIVELKNLFHLFADDTMPQDFANIVVIDKSNMAHTVQWRQEYYISDVRTKKPKAWCYLDDLLEIAGINHNTKIQHNHDEA